MTVSLCLANRIPVAHDLVVRRLAIAVVASVPADDLEAVRALKVLQSLLEVVNRIGWEGIWGLRYRRKWLFGSSVAGSPSRTHGDPKILSIFVV